MIGGEVITKGENFNIGERYDKVRDQLIFKHTSRGSKLMNLYRAFECAFHMFACMAQVLKFKISMLV